MGPNYIKHEKHHSMGATHEGPTLEEIKKNALSKILELPAVLGRGIVDHLIEYDKDTKLIWRDNLLNQMDIANLIMIRTILLKTKEEQQRTY